MFLTPVPLVETFSWSFWSRIWSTYALYDDSYANRESYGFWIDVGNGHSTILPSLIWILGMTFEILDPQVLGIIGLLSFYQEFYGTVMYFCQFLFNRRHKGKSKLEVALFVALSNGIWIVAPIVGLFASLSLILYPERNYAIFRPTIL